MIELVDLGRQYESIKTEVLAKIGEVLESKAFIQGKYAAEFERAFASMHRVGFCSGCSNGTSALFLALSACGIKAGDEVITVPNSFIATAEAISHVGAKPVFVDIDPDVYTIDVSRIEAAITERTTAIIPVHLYGHPANMDEIIRLAGKHGLKIIEDCAQAHLAEYKGRTVGSFGHAGAFSFFPGKNLGAYGDAGAVVTGSVDIDKMVKKLLNHGRLDKYYHEMVGYNFRMDGMQAAILSVKLKYLREWTEQRIAHAAYYSELLKDNPLIKTPKVDKQAKHVYHLYVIEMPERQKVMEYMKEKGIAASIHYPVPLHLQPAYRHLGYAKGDFPVAESASERILSLPMYPELTKGEIELVSGTLRQAVQLANA
jgi:dTDP-4-amino-4,6-dideoxygalactose transaminase